MQDPSWSAGCAFSVRVGNAGRARAGLTRTPHDVTQYRAEPYVVAADVYSNPAHVGRGGWTWYTGSAAWMYRVAVEDLLGITLKRGALHLDPCIAPQWPGYEAVFRCGEAELRIVVENPNGVSRGVRLVELNGKTIQGDVPLPAAGTHAVRVVLG